MKTSLIRRLVFFLLLMAGLAVKPSLAALHCGDNPTDPTANTQSSPEYNQTTSDPSATAATEVQPPPSVSYGWPEDGVNAWLTLPPQPVVRYAVVPLPTQAGWPTGAQALELNDDGQVLASISSTQLALWSPPSSTASSRSVVLPSNFTWNYPWGPSTLSAFLMLPNDWKSLAGGGLVAGILGRSRANGGPVAAIWSPTTEGTGTTTTLAPVLTGNNSWAASAFVVNSGGQTLGLEISSVSSSPPITQYAGTNYFSFLSPGGNILGGTDASPNTNSGDFIAYAPVAVNELGSSLSIVSYPVPETEGLSAADLIVSDSAGVQVLGPATGTVVGGYGMPFGSAYNRLDPQALTSGYIGTEFNADTTSTSVVQVPPVMLAVTQQAPAWPSQLEWSHAVLNDISDVTSTIIWSPIAPVEVWDPTYTQAISQGAPVTYARSNNQMQMILGDRRLVQDERIYDLQALLTPVGCWQIVSTVDINNSGSILAYARQVMNPDGSTIAEPQTVPVMLVPSVLVVDDDPADQVQPNLGQITLSVGIGFLRVASEFQSWAELISGKDYITQEPVSAWVSGAGVVLNLIDAGGLVKAGKLAVVENKVAGVAQAEIKAAGATAGGIRVARSLTKAERIAANAIAGKEAEKLALQELKAAGYNVIGSHVSAYTSQGVRYIDHLVEINGELFAVEVKSGGAARNASQLAKDAEMEEAGVTIGGPNLKPDFPNPAGTIWQIPTVLMFYP